MTTLIAWYGADSKKNGFVPASLYFASDSRISWEAPARPYPSWDFAKKVFASRATPDIFGFAGGVESGVVLLSQVVSLADHGLLFTDTDSPKRRFGKFAFAVKRTWKEYPASKRQPLEFLHGFRIGEGNAARFYVGVMRWGKSSTAWSRELIECPTGTESRFLAGLGTGQKDAVRWIDLWNTTPDRNTSRAMFSGLCDSINALDDPDTGGAPQLVGLYRKFNASAFGIAWNGGRYFDGQPLYRPHLNPELEWRNDLFERVDGQTNQRMQGAQAHINSLSRPTSAQ